MPNFGVVLGIFNCLFSADLHQWPPQRGHRFSFLPQLVEVNGSPCLKLTEDEEKMTIPGMKAIYRLYDAAGESGDPSQSLGGIFCSVILSLMSSWQVTPSWTSWPWKRSRLPVQGRSWGSMFWGSLGRPPRSFPALWSPSIAPTSGMARSEVIPSPGRSPLPRWGLDQGSWWLLRFVNNSCANPDVVACWDWCWVVTSHMGLHPCRCASPCPACPR